MALSSGENLGIAQNKTSGTTLALSTDAATSVGDIVTVQVATDNSVSTSGATTTHTSMTDSADNTYTKRGEVSNGTGGAGAGVTLSVWTSVHTTALPSGGTITFTRSGSVTAKAMSARRYGRTSGSTLAYSTPVTNTATGIPAALTTSGLTASLEKLVMRFAAVESNAASFDTASSGFTLGTDVGTLGGGNAQTHVSTRAEFLIGTGTSYTSQPSGSNLQGCSIMFAITETPVITLNNLTGSLSVNENAANATVVGTPSGYTSGSTKSLSDNAGGRFAINSSTGQITVANGSLLNREANTSHDIAIDETLSGATNTPRTTILSVTVNDIAAPAATAWAGGVTTHLDEPFDTPTNWTVGAGWGVSGGQASASSVNSFASLTDLLFTPEIGTEYTISFDMVRTAGGLSVRFGGVNSAGITTSGFKSLVVTPTSTAKLSFGGDFSSGEFTGSIDNLKVTSAGGGGTGEDPEIASTLAVATHVADLTKSSTASLAIVGGTGAALFELYDNGSASAIRTKAALSGGTYTLQIQDTTIGPSGSGEDRTDTLSLTVLGESSAYPFVWGLIF